MGVTRSWQVACRPEPGASWLPVWAGFHGKGSRKNPVPEAGGHLASSLILRQSQFLTSPAQMPSTQEPRMVSIPVNIWREFRQGGVTWRTGVNPHLCGRTCLGTGNSACGSWCKVTFLPLPSRVYLQCQPWQRSLLNCVLRCAEEGGIPAAIAPLLLPPSVPVPSVWVSVASTSSQHFRSVSFTSGT